MLLSTFSVCLYMMALILIVHAHACTALLNNLLWMLLQNQGKKSQEMWWEHLAPSILSLHKCGVCINIALLPAEMNAACSTLLREGVHPGCIQ